MDTNKRTYSQQWFKENFTVKPLAGGFGCMGTCNGQDYSFISTNAEHAQLLAEAFLKKTGQLEDFERVQNENLISNLKREIEDQKKEYEGVLKDYGERHRSQLMSVYYLLEAVEKAGTHREKEVVIMYQKLILEGIINNHDPLPLRQENFPF